MTEKPDQPLPPLSPLQRAGYTLATLWIFGVALFYYIRFTFLIYATHQTAIDDILKRLTDTLGITGA